MIRHSAPLLVFTVLLALVATGCGTTVPYLEKAVKVISQVGDAAAAIQQTSDAISQSASPFLDENLGTPLTEQKITKLDFSGLSVEIKTCNIASNNAECTFSLQLDESEPSREIFLNIARAVTPDGKDVPVAQIAVGPDNQGGGQIRSKLISGVPASGRVFFANVPSSLDHFLAMEVGVDGRALIFRNISVTK